LTYFPDFQLAYAHQAWLDERASWRSVIYLNLIRSVNNILNIVTKEMSRQNATSRPPSPVPAHPLVSSQCSLETETDFSDDETLVARPLLPFTDRHKVLKLRLAPLREVQTDLERQIGAGASEPPDLSTYYHYTDAAPFLEAEALAARSRNPRQPNEFFVRSNCGWKETLSRLHPRLSITPDHLNPIDKKRRAVVDIVAGCGEAIKSLWTDEVVQAALKQCHIRLEEESGL
jgi:guanine nucleotide-binding protein alpha-1 subunit